MPHMTIHSIKSEIKETISLSIPLVAAQLIYAFSGFIGTAMVANMGKNALAASVLVNMIWAGLSVLFFGMLNSISVLVAHQFGSRNDKAISEIMGQSFILGVLLSVIILCLLYNMPFFLRFTSQPPIVKEIAIDYIHSLLWTIPGLVFSIILEQFLTGVHRTKLVLRISILVVPIEIPIIYAFIFGKFGLPACGVAGIGYGFATTYTIVTLILGIYLYKAKHFKRFGLFTRINSIQFHWLKELVRIGLPMGCMHVIEVSTFAFTTFWVAKFGTTLLAAHQIAMQYLSFAITLVFAMSQAVTIRVGYAVGKKDISGIKNAIYTGMMLNFICIFFISTAFILFPHFFLRLDMDIHDPTNLALIHDASILLAIGGVLMLFDNFRIIGFGALRGLKDTKFTMYSTLISFWLIGLSLAYLLGFNLDYQGQGIWWGLTLGIASGAVLVLIRVKWMLKHADVDKILSASNTNTLD